MTTILVVDDERDLLEEIMDILLFEDYEVITASNGKLGLDRVYSNHPDLIISDVSMPEMDGYEFIRILRTDPEMATIPVIFLTAKPGNEYRRIGMDLGADDYLTKPFTHKELLSAVSARLSRNQTLTEVTSLYKEQVTHLQSAINGSLPHELRTPLGSILGYTEIMLEDLQSNNLDNATAKRMLESINQSGKRLYHVIERQLTYMRLERNRDNKRERSKIMMLVQDNPCPATTIIRTQAMQMAIQYNRKADLRLDMTPGYAHILDTDLHHVVGELLENAFKFSAPGQIVAILSQVTDEEYILSISDEGRGMGSDKANKIGAYIQFDRDRYEQSGIGLGLAIVRGIVALYGGNMSLQSEHNQGTTVTVTFPFALA